MIIAHVHLNIKPDQCEAFELAFQQAKEIRPLAKVVIASSSGLPVRQLS